MANRISRRLSVWTVLLAVAASGLVFAASGRKNAAEVPLNRGIARRVANFTLQDASGQPVTLYGFKGKKAVVITFMATDCPVGDLYAPRLAELNRAYKDKGVAFLAVNSNAHETAEQAVEHAKAHGLDIPVLKDPGNVVADLMLVERTCETLVIDGRAQLRYRGAIDDQYARGSRKDAPTRHSLRDALDDVLAGRPVKVASTPVAGCLIDRVEPKPPALSNAARVRSAPAEVIRVHAERDKREAVKIGRVTFAADVAAIVQRKCQSCHRPGQSGPFPLLTFDDARRHSAMIREVVDERRMPPWHADPRYGHFLNDRSLSARERATLLAWVDQGTPPGDPKDMPAPKSFPEGWTIGAPDVVFEAPEPYVVAAQGTLGYVHMKVPTQFKEDVWVQAAEAVPGDRSVVHHIVVYVDDHGKDSDGEGRRGKRHLCGYAPGDMPSVYPPGSAKKVPAGSDLIFQIHYTPNGKQRIDRSKVGLIFAKSPVTHRAYTHGIGQMRFLIPPETPNFTVNSTFTFPRDTHLLGFMPHMHLRGKSFEYRATFPDGTKEVLLSVPAYDFGWQSSYVLAEPRAMPKGTRIDCEAHFDNSAANPSNPDPKRAVTWGDQTFEEMMIGYIDFIDDAPVSR